MTSIGFDSAFEVVTNNPEEANGLQIRADLMIALRDIITDKGWKLAKVAVELGLSQSRVSELMNGKIGKFSIDSLMTCLFRLGYRFYPHYRNQTLSVQVKSF